MLDTIKIKILNYMENSNTLPKYLHDVLIGLMLGDGYLYKTSQTSNSRFEMSFGTDRVSFAEWVGNLFKDYSSTGIIKVYYKILSLNLIIDSKLKHYLFLIFTMIFFI